MAPVALRRPAPAGAASHSAIGVSYGDVVDAIRAALAPQLEARAVDNPHGRPFLSVGASNTRRLLLHHPLHRGSYDENNSGETTKQQRHEGDEATDALAHGRLQY